MSDIEREEFEQAVADRWSDSYSFTRFGDEDYYDEVLEGMWQGWQASRQAVSVPEWIKCSDRLPTEDDGQVIWTHDSYRKTVELTSWAWAQGLFKNSYITHWMPTGMIRPQPPKQEGE